MMTFALTGGIAVGKSAVEQLLADAGVPVIDADQHARSVVAPGSAGLAGIVERFGATILEPDGSLARKRLGAIVFSDPAALQALNQITHPLILDSMNRALAALRDQGAPTAVISAALMVEAGWRHAFDRLIVITCDEETRLARLMARDRSERAAAEARIRSQLPQAERARHADYLLDNSGSRADLAEAVRALLSWMQAEQAGGA